MMLATLLTFAMAPSVASGWYGPKKVSFDLAVTGSPYDAQTNDVQVRFMDGRHVEQRLAYFDGKRWSAILLARTQGAYHAQVLLNGATVQKLPEELKLTEPYPNGFVRVDGTGRAFCFDDGTPYWPIGNSLGWQNPSCPPMAQQLAMMGDAHMNWSRIWSCNWDGKNPWWPQDNHKLNGQDLNQSAFNIWDSLIDAASKAGIHFQWVLFHHGAFASMIDPEWRWNPWNKANGGFLSSPIDFFSNEEAKRRVKNFIRYVVARYGHANAILSWELFNEVENTDAARLGHWDEIGDWHREMAGYLREIDPYHHLVTSSSEMRPEITSSVDYYQPHGYPSNVGSMIQEAEAPTDRPFFYGECGLGTNPASASAQRACVRDAIWSSLLSGHSGSAEYWYWDWTAKDNLFDEYSKSNAIIEEIGLIPGPANKPVHVDLETNAHSDLVFNPGIGWSASKRLAFEFPADDSTKAMGQLSSFLQGSSHKEMGNKVQFDFLAPAEGKMTIKIGMVARAGAGIVATLDGKEVLRESWPGTDHDTALNQQFSFEYGSGAHRVVVSNPAADWVRVQAYEFSDLGRAAQISAATTRKGLLARIHRTGSNADAASLSGIPLEDGTYLLKIWNLDSSDRDEKAVRIQDGRLLIPLTLAGTDMVIILEPRYPAFSSR